MREIMNKKVITALAIGLVVFSAPLAQAKAVVTATPTQNLPQMGAVVSFKLSKLPTKNGVYIQECMAPATKGAAPTVCNSDQASQAWVSSAKADIAKGATSASGKVTMKPVPYFSKGDCVHTTCVFFITNDHNAAGDKSQDQTIPFTFSAK
jgi:hypothetical protein